jgi:hypothetical protein
MYRHHRIRRARIALAVPLASLALLITPALAGAGLAQANAASCSSWTTGPPPSPGSFDNQLHGVAALSSCNVWAVGDYSNGGIGQRLTLAEHWNGTSWKVVRTPSPGHINQLKAVSAFSSRNIWAVGHADGSTLILHWNGSSWARVLSPTPGTGGSLDGVIAVSATGAWAVGEFSPANSKGRTLVLRWNGKKWTRCQPCTRNRQRARCRDRHVIPERLGGGRILQRKFWQDPDPSLEWREVGSGHQPEPARTGERDDP